MKTIRIADIKIDGGTQSRAKIDTDIVADYADKLEHGAEFPPVVVFNDGASIWLADGFHRLHAHIKTGTEHIQAEIHIGTLRDAKLYSFGANGRHGQPPNNADKRKSVSEMLADPEWSTWSQREIGRTCGVSIGFVSKMVQELSVHGEQMRPEIRTVQRGGKTFEQNTAKIGKAAKSGTAPADPPAPAPKEYDSSGHAESQEAVAILSEENDRLNDRLAVAAMEATEEERGLAESGLADLRSQVKTMSAELNAVKSQRDLYMSENAELKKQVSNYKKKIDQLTRKALTSAHEEAF